MLERKNQVPYIIVDTPGQIEAFTWFAIGSSIAERLAATFPTCLAYVVDSTRASNPASFNMIYACPILCHTKLPFFIVFSKVGSSLHCTRKYSIALGI